jgi:hypothetical protein
MPVERCFGLEQQMPNGYNYSLEALLRRCILFFELLYRMEQGIADTTTSRQFTEE